VEPRRVRIRASNAMAETGKFLFRKVEKAIQAIERTADASATIMQTATTVIEQFSEVLGVRGGRLYVRRDGGYELVRTFGNVPAIPPGLFIPEDYVPIERVVDEGVLVMDLSAPGVDAELERRLGAERFAAIAVGDDEYILSFTVDPVAGSLKTSADDAIAVGLLDPVDLAGIYDLTLLNDVLDAGGLPRVE